MKPKTMIPLVMGVVVGGIAIKIVVDVVSSAQGATAANMTKCVVSNVDINFAEEITPEKLIVREWPKDVLPTGQYFSTKEELLSRVTGMAIPKDVPLYRNMLAPEGTPPGIQTRIKPGYRAVSIAIDEVSSVAYQLKPGDKVDVIALVKQLQEKGKGALQFSRVILQNIEVAAVGRTIASGKKGEDAAKSVARSVTLLLNPQEVTKLHLAETMGGKISLALRGNQDNNQEPVAVATPENLLGEDTQPEDEPATEPVFEMPMESKKEPVDNRPTTVVTVISGNEMKQYEYLNNNGQWELKSVPANSSEDDDRNDPEPLENHKENRDPDNPDYAQPS